MCASSFETYAQLLQQRTTLLHELAHVWHWARGDGENWFDLSDIVGGCCCCGGVTSHEERTEERVAIVIEWGLLDQLRRPVRLDVTCAQLHEQFVALTRHAPLGPIEPVCLPG